MVLYCHCYFQEVVTSLWLPSQLEVHCGVSACPACTWQCFLPWSLVYYADDLVQTFWHCVCVCVSAECWILLQVWGLEENWGTKEDGSAQGAKSDFLQHIPVPCIALLWIVLQSVSSPFISCPQSLSVVVGNKSIFIQLILQNYTAYAL